MDDEIRRFSFTLIAAAVGAVLKAFISKYLERSTHSRIKDLEKTIGELRDTTGALRAKLDKKD